MEWGSNVNGAIMTDTRSGFAAIIGRPNVGKSTLMNHLIGEKIAITSSKPQTTRNRIQTVFTDERGQIVFVDTPGFLRRTKNHLGEYMLKVSTGVLGDTDVVLWLVEPSSYIGAGDKDIAEALKNVKKPVLLVINKIDTVEKSAAAGIMESWSKAGNFAEIIPVSGLRNTNLDTLLDAIFKYLPKGPLLYDPDTLTDQPMRDIVSEIIREKALRYLNEEVPHGIAVTIEQYKVREDGLTSIEASIICEKESHKGIVIGKGGTMLRRIGQSARKDIEDLTGGPVYLKLFVKVRKDWRDNDMLLRLYGYRDERRK